MYFYFKLRGANDYCHSNKNDKKEICNRETIAALNYEIHQIIHTPFHFHATQIINPFINSKISANHDKIERLSANGETLMKKIVFLLKNLF